MILNVFLEKRWLRRAFLQEVITDPLHTAGWNHAVKVVWLLKANYKVKNIIPVVLKKEECKFWVSGEGMRWFIELNCIQWWKYWFKDSSINMCGALSFPKKIILGPLPKYWIIFSLLLKIVINYRVSKPYITDRVITGNSWKSCGKNIYGKKKSQG